MCERRSGVGAEKEIGWAGVLRGSHDSMAAEGDGHEWWAA